MDRQRQVRHTLAHGAPGGPRGRRGGVRHTSHGEDASRGEAPQRAKQKSAREARRKRSKSARARRGVGECAPRSGAARRGALIARVRRAEDERLRRAAGRSGRLRTGPEGRLRRRRAAAVRWGGIATDGVGTMRRSTQRPRGLSTQRGQGRSRRRDRGGQAHAAAARRHRVAAGQWAHDSRLEPPLFGADFAKKSEALLQALWAQGRRPAAADVGAEERRATIGIWHATADAATAAGAKAAAAAAAAGRRPRRWGGPGLRDPRPAGGRGLDPEEEAINAIRATALAATWHPQHNPAPHDVAHFIVNHAVYPSRGGPGWGGCLARGHKAVHGHRGAAQRRPGNRGAPRGPAHHQGVRGKVPTKLFRPQRVLKARPFTCKTMSSTQRDASYPSLKVG